VNQAAVSEPAPIPGARVDVSVLVPVFNEERHIREAVAAMQAQAFDGSIELLFADGQRQLEWTGIRPRCLEKMAERGVAYEPPPLPLDRLRVPRPVSNGHVEVRP